MAKVIVALAAIVIGGYCHEQEWHVGTLVSAGFLLHAVTSH